MKIIITENQLKNIILTENTDYESVITNVMGGLKNVLNLSNQNPIDNTQTSSEDVPTDGNIPKGTSGEPIKLDLTKSEDFNKYAQICDKFISKYKNPLQINGTMLANGAKRAFVKTGNYVPPELALSQLLVEGGLTASPNSRPIRTKNPFNVGNVDSGKNVYHNNVQSGIDKYYDLIATKYLTGGKKVSDLISNFTNMKGKRYASARNYESSIAKISQQVQGISNQVIGSDNRYLA